MENKIEKVRKLLTEISEETYRKYVPNFDFDSEVRRYSLHPTDNAIKASEALQILDSIDD